MLLVIFNSKNNLIFLLFNFLCLNLFLIQYLLSFHGWVVSIIVTNSISKRQMEKYLSRLYFFCNAASYCHEIALNAWGKGRWHVGHKECVVEKRESFTYCLKLIMRNTGIRKTVTEHNLKLKRGSINSYMLICCDIEFLSDTC